MGEIIIPGFITKKSEEEELYVKLAELLNNASEPQVAITAILSLWNFLCAKCGVKDQWDFLIQNAVAMKERDERIKKGETS